MDCISSCLTCDEMISNCTSCDGQSALNKANGSGYCKDSCDSSHQYIKNSECW
jgi:hypothetical protein